MLNATLLNRKPKLKDFIRALAVAAAVAGVFLGYMLLIGIPKTEARNLFNRAQRARVQGNLTLEKELLKNAYAAWPEAYIARHLD